MGAGGMFAYANHSGEHAYRGFSSYPVAFAHPYSHRGAFRYPLGNVYPTAN